MPLPKLLARINKRSFNKLEIKIGKRPVLNVIGRSSGRSYRVPLDAHPVDNGYIFFLMYGTGSDWVQNVLAAGSATLDVDGETVELRSPKIIGETEAWEVLAAGTKRPPRLAKVSDYLRMEIG